MTRLLLTPIWCDEGPDGFLVEGHSHDDAALRLAAVEYGKAKGHMYDSADLAVIRGYGEMTPDDECDFILHFHRLPAEGLRPMTRIVEDGSHVFLDAERGG